ncbi:hypothetical protein JAAARDRAFT_33666 [Jaapia argillacea MUCL 33604]|uniref:Uncharacterized protein n=1 Tax=Jaapia argillacea MUCL 33604 TaxID=933084 RepID=A0A067PYK8_9AGAM|nr:hypothetical protein JAAARDRAFT_33666 [Jaapia argillacea MUCL 33604]
MDTFFTTTIIEDVTPIDREDGGGGGNSYCVVCNTTPINTPTNEEDGGGGGNSYCIVA